ncbi:type II toxin-antitoxin system RelE/ParE family toxin [Maribrevibacterium harenarium]|uniref:Toxin n=1 Tax=Maribrevibacterium harenarium TaxID=2589817 RepID=A0A501WEB6_9GAMM|nr:type II toxin-antitoxin system RelE/ParE family toxin [Maribrevibacterium harenarium]TPE47758.1 type II toxin-antitoxin system RelE/ParE family toxin [Maribrevibacterium harenarium]
MVNKTYTYSKLAAQDLIDIYLYTAQIWGQQQADIYDAGLEHMVGLLADSPGIGRSCDDIRAGCRRFEHEHHIIFYRQRKNDIFIIRILHKSMDITRHISS